MIVCVCARVSERQIREVVTAGAHSLECLQFELGVAMKCGRCADCASRVLCDARGEHHLAHHHTVTSELGLQVQMA